MMGQNHPPGAITQTVSFNHLQEFQVREILEGTLRQGREGIAAQVPFVFSEGTRRAEQRPHVSFEPLAKVKGRQ